jgi:hypothetical protein
MKKFLVLTTVLSALSGTAAEQQADRPAPVYEVHRAVQPIAVDGRVDDAAWQKAQAITAFVRNSDGAPSPLETDARMLYDDEFLYFAFRVVDANIWATMKRRDEHLWTEEVVEVFLQPDLHRPGYVELEVNPLGTMIDIFLIDVRKPLKYESWNSARLKWAVHVDGTVDGQPGDRQWTCEIALPLEDLPVPKPKPGDEMRLNLYRVEKRPDVAGLAWSPTMKNDFHMPAKFGRLIFR